MLDQAWWNEGAELEEEIVVEETSHRDIAIIGMAAMLPKADNVRRFWKNVTEQADAIGPFPQSRRKDVESLLADTKLPDGIVSYYDGAYLEDIDKFDYRFFRLSPKEAALLSPNQRLWLETAWSALEDAGYGGDKLYGSRTGVYLGYNGDAFHDYKRLIAQRDPSSLSLAIPGNLSSIVASRISYLLDFKGPSLTVDTACSSSLVALHLAVQALRSGECEQALIGGVKTYLLPVDLGIKIGIESIDARARTFDNSSSGTGGGEGSAAVLLKPLGKALRDGDAIYAVIKGSAVNQDGASIGITAPSVSAQEEVIVKAWQDGDIAPETVGYMEAHGTGTRLGDPIEIDGITRAFRRYTDKKQFCAIGSVKTNIGHLDTTAGIVGLMKAALALKHKQLPPMLHFRQPNAEIPFVESPVYVSDKLRPWTSGDSPRRAGVSAFGMSGTNCHVVLEEAPEVVEGLDMEESGHVLALSAKSETALRALAVSYAEFVSEPQAQSAALRDFCYTANTGRGHHGYRAAIAASSMDELRDGLTTLAELLNAADWSWETAGQADRPGAKGIWLGRVQGSQNELLSAEEAALLGPEELCASYVSGGQWNWDELYRDSVCQRVNLPAYPFDRTRCWLEAPAVADSFYRSPAEAPGAHAAALAPEEGRPAVTLTGRKENVYSGTEEVVAGAWGQVLGFQSLNVDDHYYELGGDSILALQIAGMLSSRLGVAIGVADILQHPTVEALSRYADQENPELASSREASLLPSEGGVYPLSRAQRRIYYNSHLPGAGLHHNMPLAYVVEGPIDAERLQAAFSKLTERHESLRTTFELSEDGQPEQHVHAAVPVKVERTQVDSEEEFGPFLDALIRPFDLAELPLFRIGLASAPSGRHLLVLDTHHIISDGASLALLLQEMTALYGGLALAPISAQYRDFALWQRDLMADEAMETQRRYWLEDALSGDLPKLRLPLDYPRPPMKSQLSRTFRFTVPAELTASLQDLSKRHHVSLHTTLLSLYTAVMHRYSNQDDLIIGSLVSGRDQAEFRGLVGVFINFLPIRVQVSPETPFTELLQAVNSKTLQAYANGQYPFDETVVQLKAGSDRSRNPVYDTMLVFHNHAAGSEQFQAGSLTFTEYPLERHTSALDVKLDLFVGSSGELRGVLEYDAALFNEETIAGLAGHFVEMAASAAVDSSSSVGSLKGLTAAEQAHYEERRRRNDTTAAAEKALDNIHVHLASTFTSEPVERHLKNWLHAFGMNPVITFAPYNQIIQGLLDEASAAAEGGDGDAPAAQVLLIRPEDWVSPYAASDEERLERLEADLDRLLLLLKDRAGSVPYFAGLFPFSSDGPFNRVPEDRARAFAERWRNGAAAIEGVFLLEFADTATRYGVVTVEDAVTNEEGHIPFTDAYFAALGTEIARALVAWKGNPFKVIVVDADNTLWHGVCGESGPEGVTVTPAFAAFQQLLLRKRSEGMLLALCSKNNEQDVWDVFSANSGMVLGKEHFAAWRVNWQPKPDNIRELAKDLNLGLDSLIFVDDNAAECLGMMAQCPEVLTLKLPEEEEIAAFLPHVWAWDRSRVTGEDRKRADMYNAERRRKEAEQRVATLEEYYDDLQMKVSFRILAADEVARAAQLTLRTNQFNLSGIRRSEADIRSLMQKAGTKAWIVEAADRYGDYGLVGLIVADVRDAVLTAETFLLSCRVLGRGVERAILSGLKHEALAQGCQALGADFRPTAKNKPFLQFLEQTGWHKPEQPEDDGVVPYTLPLDAVAEAPSHVAFYEGTAYEKVETPEEAAGAGDTASANAPAAVTAAAAALHATAGAGTVPASYQWNLPAEREEQLLHRTYLLPLRYPNAAGAAGLAAYLGQSGQGQSGGRTPTANYEAPAGEIEQAVAEVWEELLGHGPYGRHDHFFDAGGDSLQAAGLVSMLVRRFGVRVTLTDLFRHAGLKEMAALMSGGSNSANAEQIYIPKAPEAELYPVSYAQRRMYFLQEFDPSGTAYNIPSLLLLRGVLHRDRFQDALRLLAARHEGLRTSFVMQDGEPYQRIHAPADHVEFAEIELAEESMLHDAARAMVQPFNLQQAPLFRVGLFRLGEERYGMLFDIHHIVADGVSVNVLIEDFLALYGGGTLPSLDIQYKDYAVWQESSQSGQAGSLKGISAEAQEQSQAEGLEQERYGAQEQAWLERLSGGAVPKLELPLDYVRPTVKSTEGRQLSFEIGKEDVDALKAVAQENGSTLFMTLMAAYSVWLMRISGGTDVVVGTPVAGRTAPGTERLIGVFVNPLAIRMFPDSGKTFAGLLQEVKGQILASLEGQEVPFEHLVERMQVERDLSRNPLFDTMFSMLNMDHAELSLPDLTVEQLPCDFGVSQFDIGLYALEGANGLTITIQYASTLFKAETMKSWVSAFQTLLRHLPAAPDTPLGAIELMTAGEKQQVVEQFNATEVAFPRELTLHEMFRQQAKRTPERTALVYESEELTYRELDERSDRLAGHLREQGVKRSEPVGLMAQRSAEMMIGMLAIIKAGGAYVPLPPEFPEDRLRYMAEGS
ncbi:HAD-IIIC family phosphatase, partial [Paenibacillus oenotherae]